MCYDWDNDDNYDVKVVVGVLIGVVILGVMVYNVNKIFDDCYDDICY